VEHPCQQCGAIVADGVAFCSQCKAPQIRVLTYEPPAAYSSGEHALAPESVRALVSPGRVQWSHAVPAAALAGAITAVAMLLPLGLFGLEMVAAGALAVLFYRRRTPLGELTPGMGARIGAASGLFGFGLLLLLTGIGTLLFPNRSQLRQTMEAALEQAAARSSDPQAQQALAYFKTPEGMALVIALGVGVMLMIFLAMSSLGGMLGAVVLRRRERGKL
jgi:hypothetical protein